LNEKMIYHCVEIYKQPSLNHPLLKNHKIQMKPSFAISEPENKVKSRRYDQNVIDCPNGTVPILKNTKEYVRNAQYFAAKRLNPLTVVRPGEHIAVVRSRGQGPYHGVAAPISIHDLNISSDQYSSANIFVGSTANNNTFNLIETGWMVNPSMFGDGRTWGYGYWKGAEGAGCYNTICPGFIQVSETVHLSGPLRETHDPNNRYINVGLQQDKISGNWWASDINKHKPDTYIGYWPKEMFDLIANAADIVGVGGVVQASPTGKSPPMGNGHLPALYAFYSARIPDLHIMDASRKFRRHKKFKLEMLVDSKKCYGLRKDKITSMFLFGGPGGDACGI
ncbi:hypothetical protein CARUB_v10002741mg, partial [Capsella rubella]